MPTRLVRPVSERVDPTIVTAWKAIPATIAADLFRGRTLVDPAIRPIRPFADGCRLAGTVVTAWCEPADYGPVHHALALADAGDVIVVDAGGRLDAAMIGEILCGVARRKGVAGVAVDGAVRDVGTLAGWPDFPVFSRGRTARGPSSMQRGSVGEPIVLGGVRTAPGDLILGDDDGLVVIPHDEVNARLGDAQAMVEAEVRWEAELAGGAGNLEVFGVPPAEEG